MSVYPITLKNGITRYIGTYSDKGKRVRFDTREEAEKYVTKLKATGNPTKNSWFGWQNWVVPAPLMRELLETNKKYLEAIDFDGLGNGWKELLAHRIALVLRGTPEAALRRIYDISYGKSKVLSANYAEAICLILGLDLDRDTNIPTLPGNKKLAAELIRCRSNRELTDKETNRLARQTVRLSALILKYPHNQARLQDMAPFDCLRPPK
jgi:hypothetical protein